MIDEDITITELANKGLIKNSTKYVQGVLDNCYLQYQKRGWLGEHVRVRIGRVGNGTNPHYTVLYVSDQFDISKPFATNGADTRGSPQQFSGQNHKTKIMGFDRTNWSKSVQSLAELEDLKTRLKIGNLRLP